MSRLYFRVNIKELNTENNTPEYTPPDHVKLNGGIKEEDSEDSVSMPDEQVQPIRLDRWSRNKTMTLQDIPADQNPGATMRR